MEETIEKKVREALDSQAVVIPGFFDMDKYKQQLTDEICTLEASFEVICRMLEEALLYISGARDIVIKCCPNRKVAYLATHSKKRRTRKKNIHRAIKILEELAEVNND